MAMRRLAIVLLFLPALAFAAAPLRFETRSQTHSMTLEVNSAGSGERYEVRVTDLQSGERLATAKFAPDDRMEAVTELRDLQIHIRVTTANGRVAAWMEIDRGDLMIDSMSSTWTLKSRPKGVDISKALRVGGDVKAPVVISKVEPSYTDEARKARISGIVIAEAVIDKSGNVRDVRILKPLPFGLDQAAADAMHQWKFSPATLNGEPVDVIFNVTVNFKLDVPPKPAQ